MKGYIYIDENLIGESNFRISDASMGGITGDLIPNEKYQKYRSQIQSITEKTGIANSSHFNFRILIDEIELNPEGGIGISDVLEFDEIIIESAGNSQELIKRLKK